MSKNIVIQEGGIGKQLTVDKLKTNLVGGGTCLWVPEDEVQLISKTITANGTYNPNDDNCYGYSQVIVNVPGGAGGDPGGPGSSIVGKDSDGDDAIVSSDPETGDLSQEKLPSSIAITTPPSKTTYQDGESISISGMVVKGYLRSGDLWTDETHPEGIVPNSELVISPTTADASQAEPSEEWDVSGTGLNTPVYLSEVSTGSTYYGVAGEQESRFITSLYSSAPVYIFQIPYAAEGFYSKCFVSTAPFHGESRRVCPPSWDPHWETWSGQAISVDGGTAYVGHIEIAPTAWNVAVSAAQDDLPQAAAIAVIGGHPKYDGGVQHIGVLWPRIRDGKVLETGFDIIVTEVTP